MLYHKLENHILWCSCSQISALKTEEIYFHPGRHWLLQLEIRKLFRDKTNMWWPALFHNLATSNSKGSFFFYSNQEFDLNCVGLVSPRVSVRITKPRVVAAVFCLLQAEVRCRPTKILSPHCLANQESWRPQSNQLQTFKNLLPLRKNFIKFFFLIWNYQRVSSSISNVWNQEKMVFTVIHSKCFWYFLMTDILSRAVSNFHTFFSY